MTSGTFQALLFDELKEQGQETQFTKVFGRTQTISALAIFLASILASPAILMDYPFVLILSSGAVFMSGVLILKCPITYTSSIDLKTSYFSTLKQGIKSAVQDQKIKYLLIFLASVSIGGGLDEFWPLFADQVGVPKYGLGVFIAVLSAVEAIATFFAYRFENKSLRFFYALNLLNGLLLLLAAYLFNWISLILLMVFSFMFILLNTVLEGKLHHAINSDTRATIASVSGFLIELVVLGVFLGFGGLAQVLDYQSAFLGAGLLVGIIGLGYLLFSQR